MGRLERKVLRINERIAALVEEERLVSEELMFHRHLDDDARRDAAVTGHAADVADARETAADVARFERVLDDVRSKRARLEERRQRLLERLADL
jgi:hypothetical protein